MSAPLVEGNGLFRGVDAQGKDGGVAMSIITSCCDATTSGFAAGLSLSGAGGLVLRLGVPQVVSGRAFSEKPGVKTGICPRGCVVLSRCHRRTSGAGKDKALRGVELRADRRTSLARYIHPAEPAKKARNDRSGRGRERS